MFPRLRQAQHACLILLCSAVTACATTATGDGPGGSIDPRALRNAVPRAEPPSARGNPESYVVFGKRYFVMPSSNGYRERGMASWYGKKFHGRLTSNGEKYNMYAMTAAHKTLPLPSYVEVTNLSNGHKAIVRVNDRGPFHSDRIIDLSYSAAQKLDMLRSGTAEVEVRVLLPTNQPGDADNSVVAVAGSQVESKNWRDESHLQNRIFIQVGAFSMRQNAERLMTQLMQARFPNVQILDQLEQNQALHRVRIGPLSSVAATDYAVERLEALGLADYRVVVE